MGARGQLQTVIESAGLTRKQAAAKDFIQKFSAEKGFPPSFQEIGDACGGCTRTNAKYLVDKLIARGHATMVKHRARTLRIVGGICPTCGHGDA